MTDSSQGPGWWLASDGKWYPPETWAGPPLAVDPTRSANPIPMYQVQSPAPATASRPTNGMAVASLVCACAGIIPFLFGIPCILGVVFGFVARGQIKQSDGVQGGSGLALAGIIVGFSLIALFIIVVALAVTFGHTSGCTTFDNTNCTVN